MVVGILCGGEVASSVEFRQPQVIPNTVVAGILFSGGGQFGGWGAEGGKEGGGEGWVVIMKKKRKRKKGEGREERGNIILLPVGPHFQNN